MCPSLGNAPECGESRAVHSEVEVGGIILPSRVGGWGDRAPWPLVSGGNSTTL